MGGGITNENKQFYDVFIKSLAKEVGNVSTPLYYLSNPLTMHIGRFSISFDRRSVVSFCNENLYSISITVLDANTGNKATCHIDDPEKFHKIINSITIRNQPKNMTPLIDYQTNLLTESGQINMQNLNLANYNLEKMQLN